MSVCDLYQLLHNEWAVVGNIVAAGDLSLSPCAARRSAGELRGDEVPACACRLSGRRRRPARRPLSACSQRSSTARGSTCPRCSGASRWTPFTASSARLLLDAPHAGCASRTFAVSVLPCVRRCHWTATVVLQLPFEAAASEARLARQHQLGCSCCTASVASPKEFARLCTVAVAVVTTLAVRSEGYDSHHHSSLQQLHGSIDKHFAVYVATCAHSSRSRPHVSSQPTQGAASRPPFRATCRLCPVAVDTARHPHIRHPACRCITTFSSHHFRAFVRNSSAAASDTPSTTGNTTAGGGSGSGSDEGWLRIDDTVIDAAGSLRDVLAACRAEGACPTLLFYERATAV